MAVKLPVYNVVSASRKKEHNVSAETIKKYIADQKGK